MVSIRNRQKRALLEVHQWESNGKGIFVKLSGVSDSSPYKGGVARLRDGVVGAVITRRECSSPTAPAFGHPSLTKEGNGWRSTPDA